MILLRKEAKKAMENLALILLHRPKNKGTSRGGEAKPSKVILKCMLWGHVGPINKVNHGDHTCDTFEITNREIFVFK